MRREECWAVETSRDGQRWRFFGRAWKAPGEAVILHAVPRFVRFRRLVPDEQGEWSQPLESRSDHPMSLLRMDEAIRDDLWPEERHLGLPVLLPGGEEGRLERFERSEDGSSWSYSLEFRGAREG